MVTDVGGIGDESFNASAWRGLERARDQLGAEVRYLESRTGGGLCAQPDRTGAAGFLMWSSRLGF